MIYLNSYAKISTLALALVIGFLAQSVHAQATTQLSIDNARPVEDAVNELEARYGYMITYEESPYVYEGDLATDPAEKPGAKPYTHPRGGTLNLTVPASSSISVQAMASILDQLVRAQASRGEGGHFRVIQAGDVFHIVPTEARDKNGNYVPQTPILDTRISLPAGNYSLNTIIDEICKAVSIATHTKVVDGRMDIGGPIDRANPYPYHLQADSGPARDVLTRALESAFGHHKLTWELSYSYWDEAPYFLSVGAHLGHPAVPAVTAAPK